MSSLDPMDTVSAARDSSRRSLHCKVKRNYNVMVACVRCRKPHLVNDKVIGYCCPSCGKYQNASEAHARYENGEVDWEGREPKGSRAPAVKGSEGRDYTMLRDEYEVRAELYSNGVTRESVGMQKFDRVLKSELIKNKCFRGADKTGLPA
jgi:hypothetical protein